MAKNLVTTTYMDVTELTSMIACDKDYYDRVMSSSSSEDPTSGKPKDYALYLVNEGSTEGENRLTDVYYGGRKWTDLVILTYGPEGYIDYNGNILPDVTDWADEKLYIVIYDDGVAGSDTFAFNLYIKHDGEAIPVTTFSTKEIISDGERGIVQFVWNDGDSTITNIPMTDHSPAQSGVYLLHRNVAAVAVYNPSGEGSLSLNRKEGTTVGNNSVAVGTNGTSSGNSSTAEGYNTSATGNYSHSEGYDTTASGISSHAEGSASTAEGRVSHSEGQGTHAIGNYSHSEGSTTIASGISSHAEGDGTGASGDYSHAEGKGTSASGDSSHSEGDHTTALEDGAHSEGHYTVASGKGSHAEGGYSNPEQNPHSYSNCGTTASGTSAHSEGFKTLASGDYSHAEGESSTASGTSSHSEGAESTASGNYSHSEGYDTTASGGASHSEGTSTESSGIDSHAEGYYTLASGAGSHTEGGWRSTTPSSGTNTNISSGINSHTEGDTTKAYGTASHAEGYSTTAGTSSTTADTMTASHAEGYMTTASGKYSHAEGNSSISSGQQSHAEGYTTVASGNHSHAEGTTTEASGIDSHAEGAGSVASGVNSHAQGLNTVAQGANQDVSGKNNIADSTNLVIVGNGVSPNAKSNAYTLDSSGNAWYSGDVYVGSTSGTNKDAGSIKLATVHESGSTFSFTMNPSTFVLTAVLTSVDGTVLSTQTVDLPLEEVVVDGRYDAGNKTLILTLKNGTEIEIDISDIISGLVNEDDFEAYQQQVTTALAGKVDVSDYTQDMSDIQDQIDAKVDQTDYDDDMDALDQRLDSLESEIENQSISVEIDNVPVADLEDALEDTPLSNLVISIEPNQDFNGYDKPWAGGQGKNLTSHNNFTVTGRGPSPVDRESINIEDLSDGFYTMSWTSEPDQGAVGDPTALRVTLNTVDTSVSDNFYYSDGLSRSITFNKNSSNPYIEIVISTLGTNVQSELLYVDIKNLMIESGTTVTSYEPYENECPITGYTSSNVYVGGSSGHPEDTYNIDWEDEAGTVYHGSLNVTTGELTVDYAEIPSYDGETLPGKWMSSLDEYTEGGTPTEGAQVVYELDTPITYQLDPTQVNTLTGSDSYVWADTGDIEKVEYKVDLKSYIDTHGGGGGEVDPISASTIEDILDGTYVPSN